MKKIGKLIVASAVLLVANTATAEGWQITVAPNIDLAFKKSDFSVEFGGGGGGNDLIQPTFTTLTPSLAMSVGPIYGVVSYELTVNDWNSDSLSMSGPVLDPVWAMTQDSFERNEVSLTLGYRVFSGNKHFGPVNIFVGYLQGASVWHNNTVSASSTVTSYEYSRYIFSEKGIYLGANYTQSFGEKGSLSLSAAYGLLSGNLAILSHSYYYDSAFPPPSSSSGDDLDYMSDARGYSVGVTWTGPITGNLSYRVGLKHIKYNFDVTDVRNNITGSEFSVSSFGMKIHEEMNSFFFGVSSYF